MDIGRAFSFIFQDPKWITKILILAVLIVIPIVGWLIIGGYFVRLLRNVIDGDPAPLPEWNDWGGDIASGLKALIVLIIWGIPLWILQVIGRAADSFLLSTGIFIIQIGYGALQISALSDLARSGNIADALNLRPLNRVLNNLGAYAVYVVGAFIFALFALIGTLAFLIGVLFTLAIALAATTHLGGQAYRIAEGHPSAAPAARF